MGVQEAIEALARDPTPAHASALDQAVKAVADPRPFLGSIAGLLDLEAVRDSVRSTLLQAFQPWAGDTAAIGAILDDIRKQNPSSAEVATFVETARRANQSILDEAYRKMLRGLTQSYLSDGTVARCPKCRSTNVLRGMGWFEFTDMKCLDCSHSEYADEYQLEDWYPEA